MLTVKRFLGLAAMATALACVDTAAVSDPLADTDAVPEVVPGADPAPGLATLTVLLTDAPSPYFESVEITIGEIVMIPVDTTPIRITDHGGTFDLLDLQNGVTALLAHLPIEPGDYRQMRLIVEDVSVSLKPDYQFRSGGRREVLRIPSAARSGIKINLDGADGDSLCDGVNITPGETILVIDFDVSQNFKLQGSPNSRHGFTGVMFTPMVRAVVMNVAGSISGTVTDAAGAPIAGASVTATLEHSAIMEDLQTSDAGAVSDANGEYTLQFLSPGTYSVFATVDGTASAPITVEVGTAEEVAGADFSF